MTQKVHHSGHFPSGSQIHLLLSEHHGYHPNPSHNQLVTGYFAFTWASKPVSTQQPPARVSVWVPNPLTSWSEFLTDSLGLYQALPLGPQARKVWRLMPTSLSLEHSSLTLPLYPHLWLLLGSSHHFFQFLKTKTKQFCCDNSYTIYTIHQFKVHKAVVFSIFRVG